MKLSTILSFTALSATATLAFPLLPFRGLRARAGLEERDVYAPAPVRRSDPVSSVVPTSTGTSAESTATGSSSSDTATTTTTSSASEATSTSSDSSPPTSVDSTDTWLYSTLTDNGAVSTPPASTSTGDPTTETASATTETDAPQSTGGSYNSGNYNNSSVDNSGQIIIRIREVITIKEVIFVEQPILVAVQINIKVRQTIIVNQIQNVFISRFDHWDQNVVDDLGLVISQQFDILTRSQNSGFDNLSNDQYNRYVSKFISQFQVFSSFQLVDVQQFGVVLKSFGVDQLATFYGRSDSIFSQDTFNKFDISSFTVFVQQLTVIVESVSVDSFDSDNLFGFGSAGSIQV